ncbi:MAG: diguanylate cyclase/phosphodiesterase (GGDEF & EAL domains) with PAS/PAC sensor(s) [uncultured Acidimicrobiales bacterium]|uniref:Diguanylate cyclase/phosphodiesterase (GGDEF & EAL domains) with PAS/PAC sensor(S) n=1 Tax=uncultured Acidimicrobiales bacterium TaxID=310071 RepID=A0A6J4HN94_9ACTN|nr:MAG: diguanylate cyclase/phosphodiesterase (GGDEF & EAL domains) with PAS/PAC sensor(s) [uncultured Acidimicrobiales bacterium]
MAPPRPALREISNDVIAPIIDYVERALGAHGVDELLGLAGEERPLEELRDARKWGGYLDAVALFDAASELCGDSDVGQRVGEELFRRHRSQGYLTAMQQACATPADALRLCADYSTKLSIGRTHRCVEEGPNYIVIESHGTDGAPSNGYFCSMTAGHWGQVPTLFGFVGVSVETRCQARGHETCRVRVSWGTEALPVIGAPGSEVDFNQLMRDFEVMQSVGRKLASAADLSAVLDGILDGVDGGITAARIVVAVKLESGERLIRSRGVRPADADGVASQILAHDQASTVNVGHHALSALTVPLVSSRGMRGAVTAIQPPGTSSIPGDRRKVEAFAEHAAAAFEAVWTRQLAEHSQATANGLLNLARAVAEAASPEEVGERLTGLLPQLVGADVASVWWWDGAADRLRLQARTGGPLDGDDVGTELGVEDHPEIRAFMNDLSPLMLDAADAAALVPLAVDGFRISQCAVVPVIARGAFAGLVCAGFIDRPALSAEQCFARLAGAAGITATALDNALLLQQIRHQALHDALTGLPNRPLLEDRARQALTLAERAGDGISLLFLDLDRFKNVNDTLGHQAGDELIRQVAFRLRSRLRASDTLARMGGDEFVVLLPDTSTVPAATKVAQDLVDTLRAPFEIAGRNLFVSGSVGVATSPLHGSDYDTLLQRADAAMYEAKGDGGNSCSAPSVRTPHREQRLDLETRLHSALERHELVVLYQPQIEMATMKVKGVEALIRWDHESLGRLAPGEFLAIAEESGVIVQLDRYVREIAFGHAREWAEAGLPLQVAVNVTAADLRRPSFLRELAAELSAARVDPRLIELEVTDRVVMTEDELRPVLHHLRDLGVRLAVDDFGTGSSVLNRLQGGPFNTLKIDRSLIERIGHTGQAPVVQAVINMAHDLGLSVVAEGVETSAQLALLRRYECDLVQGFLFSTPIDPVSVVNYADSPHPDRTALTADAYR